MDYKIRVNPSERMAYLPKDVVERLGAELTIFPNTVAAILYPTGEDPRLVLKSVRSLLRHLQDEANIAKAKARISAEEGRTTDPRGRK